MSTPLRASVGDSVVYGRSELAIEERGDITTDHYGLSSGSVVYSCLPKDALFNRPAIDSEHPDVPFLKCVRSRITYRQRNLAAIICDYEGVEEETESEYELVLGTNEEPIATHPNFTNYIGGKPSNPLNSAVFVDEEGQLTEDDTRGIFSHFSTYLNTPSGNSTHTLNPLAGVESYLDGGRATWKQTYFTPTNPTDTFQIGQIDTPPGLELNFGTRNWIFMGATIKKRGGSYSVCKEWLLSGPKGWNPKIYSSTGE